MELDNCRFIVTGAARGMGAHFALRLTAAGAHVAAGDVDEAGLDGLQAQVSGAAGVLVTRTLDVSREDQVGDFVEWAYDAMGGLNGLVNNAGILRDGLLVKKDRATGEIVRMSAEQWQAVIDVNLTGATFMARDVAAKMVAMQTGGVLINLSSVARHGNRGQSNYVAAKAALAANCVTWARELGRYGIRVAGIAPGMVETPMTAGMSAKAREALVAAVPCGRIGQPEDIWLAVKFAIECEYLSGRVVDVDGGLSM